MIDQFPRDINDGRGREREREREKHSLQSENGMLASLHLNEKSTRTLAPRLDSTQLNTLYTQRNTSHGTATHRYQKRYMRIYIHVYVLTLVHVT